MIDIVVFVSTDCSQSEDAYRIEIGRAKKRLSPLHIKGCSLNVVAARGRDQKFFWTTPVYFEKWCAPPDKGLC
jgi:hypothetical protein